MSKRKMGNLFRRGKHTNFEYHALDYAGGYTFSSGVAYGQVNQVLDLAAKDPKNAEVYVKVADRWLNIIERLDEESAEPQQPIGFYVQREEENDDESDE